MNLTRHAQAPTRLSRCAYEESSHTSLIRRRYLMRGQASSTSACSVGSQLGWFPRHAKSLSLALLNGSMLHILHTASAVPPPSQARYRKMKCWFCHDAKRSPNLV